MTSPSQALFASAAMRVDSTGSLELKAKRNVWAKFYFNRGDVYALVINGRTPPVSKRLSWSLNQDAHTESVQDIVRRHKDETLAFDLLRAHVISETTMSELARDFFLHAADEVLTKWGNVQEQWHQGDILGNEEALTVPPIAPEVLLSYVERRAEEVEQFTEWLNVNPGELSEVQIHPGLVEVHPTSDVENVILSLSPESPSINELANRSGWIGMSQIITGLRALHAQRAIRLSKDGDLLRDEDQEQDSLPPVVLPALEETEVVEQEDDVIHLDLDVDSESHSFGPVNEDEGSYVPLVTLDEVNGDADEQPVLTTPPVLSLAPLSDPVDAQNDNEAQGESEEPEVEQAPASVDDVRVEPASPLRPVRAPLVSSDIEQDEVDALIAKMAAMRQRVAAALEAERDKKNALAVELEDITRGVEVHENDLKTLEEDETPLKRAQASLDRLNGLKRQREELDRRIAMEDEQQTKLHGALEEHKRAQYELVRKIEESSRLRDEKRSDLQAQEEVCQNLTKKLERLSS